MPQSMNKRVRLDMRMAAPVNKGSLRGNIFDFSAQTRKRALRMNDGQDAQLERQTKIMNNNKKEVYIKECKRIRQIDNSIKNLEIYQKALRSFMYDKLLIVNKVKREGSKMTFSAKRRIGMESKILHSGFSFDILKPQMDSVSRELNPKQRRINKLHQQYIVSKARSDIVFSRADTFSGLLRTYRNKEPEVLMHDNYQNPTHKIKLVKLPTINNRCVKFS